MQDEVNRNHDLSKDRIYYLLLLAVNPRAIMNAVSA